MVHTGFPFLFAYSIDLIWSLNSLYKQNRHSDVTMCITGAGVQVALSELDESLSSIILFGDLHLSHNQYILI